jgi:hypothetical protein
MSAASGRSAEPALAPIFSLESRRARHPGCETQFRGFITWPRGC